MDFDWDIGGILRLGIARISPQNQQRLRQSLKKNTTLKSIIFLVSRLTDAIVDDLCKLIEENHTLRTLEFVAAQFTDAGLSKVLTALCQNTTLTSIIVRRSRLTDAVVPDLCRFLEVNKVMEDIQFYKAQFTDSGLSRILQSLCKKQRLEELAIWDSYLTDAVVPDVCRFLEMNKVLVCLQLHRATFSDAGFSRVLRSLCKNSTLEMLAIWESPLTDTVVGDFCQFLEVNKVLTNLHFQAGHFTDTGFSQMMKSLCANSSLRLLDIKESPLTDAVIPALCSFLEGNKILGCIQFWRSKFTDSGFSRVLHSLCRNSTMESIGMHQDKLTDAVVDDLCTFLEVSKMSYLKFYHSQFTDDGFSRILQSLCRNFTLRVLTIWWSQLTDAVVPALCRFLEVDMVMVCLQLHEAKFTDAGFSRILQSLCRNRRLNQLSLFESRLSDAVVNDLCRFLEVNKVMTHLQLGYTRFTDAALSKLLQSIVKGSTLQKLSLHKPPLTDAVVPGLCKFLEVNKVMIELTFFEAVFTDSGFSTLLESFQRDTTVKVVIVNDFIDDSAIQPLIEFVELRKDLTEIRSIARGQTPCLRIIRRDHSQTYYYYYILTVDGQVRILRRSECLQTKLKDFLMEHAVPSAIDIMKNELILFVQKDGGHKFLQDLNEQFKNIDVTFVNACKVEPLESPFVFEFHDNDEKCCPGSCVSFTDSSDSELYSSVGAILKDDKEKLYFVSTFHGNEFKKCHILNNKDIVCKCVAEVHQMSPLLDACLIEVTEAEGQSKCSPTLPIPYVEPALCGPYTGPTEDLVTKYGSGPVASSADKYTLVKKYGDATKLTAGVLVYSHFTLPEKGITDALLLRPNSGIGSFTEGGDSGAVIFRNYPCRGTHTYTSLCFEGLAFTCGGVSVKERKATVATRLDLVIKHFEKELDTKLYLLGTHKCVLAVLARKLWLMSVGGTQKAPVVE